MPPKLGAVAKVGKAIAKEAKGAIKNIAKNAAERAAEATVAHAFARPPRALYLAAPGTPVASLGAAGTPVFRPTPRLPHTTFPTKCSCKTLSTRYIDPRPDMEDYTIVECSHCSEDPELGPRQYLGKLQALAPRHNYNLRSRAGPTQEPAAFAEGSLGRLTPSQGLFAAISSSATRRASPNRRPASRGRSRSKSKNRRTTTRNNKPNRA